MSETWRGSYVYSSLGAAARHIQQHFPSVYLCTYNIVSLLWASHSCYSSIHLLTHFAVFSLCSPLCAELCFGHFSHSLSLNSLGRLFSVCLLVFFLICCFVSVHLGNLFPSQPFCWSLFPVTFWITGVCCLTLETGCYSVVGLFLSVFPLSPAALSSFWLSQQAAECHTTNTCTLTVGSELTFACLMLLGWVSTLLHGYWTRTALSRPLQKENNSFADTEHNFPERIHIEMQMKRDVKSEAGWASAPPLLSCCLFTVLKITLHIAQNTLVASDGGVCFVCYRAERPLDLHWDLSPRCVHSKINE